MAIGRRKRIVLLSGPTNSGKTTLSKELAEKIKNCLLVHQDPFYHPDEFIFSKGLSWDHTEAINWNEIRRKVEFSEKQLVIIEGTMVVDELIGLGKKELLNEEWKVLPVWLDIEKELAESRRSSRADYEVADPPGYFKNEVWPLSCRKKKLCEISNIEIFAQKDILLLKTLICQFLSEEEQ